MIPLIRPSASSGHLLPQGEKEIRYNALGEGWGEVTRFSMTRRQKIVLISILILGAFLILFRLGRHDMLGDDAHYALRGLGYFDYVASFEQTTPVHWFGFRPLWSLFSFHDHPSLFFLIQFFFFKIFGVSVVVSRLPSVFAAVGSILVAFFLAKRLAGNRAALISAGAMAVNSYFIWTGRIGLLESAFIFFLLLGILYFTKALDEPKYFRQAGFFLGLSLLTKYTFFFAAPALLAYLVWRNRTAFRSRLFWKGIFIFFLVSLPIIIYNIGMYQSRGHFDVQLADLFGQTNADWKIISNRVSGFHFDPVGFFRILISGVSWPYFAIFAVSFLANIYLIWKEKKFLYFLPIFVFTCFYLFFSLLGSTPRWLGVVTPFMAVTIGIAADYLFSSLESEKKYKFAFGALLSAAALFCIFYSINTNTLRKPIGSKIMYADFRIENYGYNQLDREITKLLRGARPTAVAKQATTTWWYPYIKPETIEFSGIDKGSRIFNNLIIFDSNTNWFPKLWIFEKWKLYHRFTIMTSEEFLKVARSEADLEKMDTLGFEGVYFIKAGAKVMETAGLSFPEIEQLYDDILRTEVAPKIIHDDQGREAFYIYAIKFEEVRAE